MNKYAFRRIVDKFYKKNDILRVPENIEKPKFLLDNNFRSEEISILNDKDIKIIKNVGEISGNILKYLRNEADKCKSWIEINEKCHNYIISRNSYPSCQGFMGFPSSLTISLNDIICHGIPYDIKIEDGDFMNLDITIYKDGFFGDCSTMYTRGKIDDKIQFMIDKNKECLDEVIKITKAGIKLSDIGYYIENFANKNNLFVNKHFCGHGIGKYIHMNPLVEHVKNGNDLILKENMVITIEPIFSLENSDDLIMWKDEWTVQCPGVPSSQFEHMILIQKDKSVVLTPN